MSGNKPEDTIRDGNLKATIWRNEGENGPFYSVTITKTFRDQDGELRDTHSLGSDDLLRVSELARRSHHRVNELRREHARAPERKTAQEDRATADADRHQRSDQGRDQRRQRKR